MFAAEDVLGRSGKLVEPANGIAFPPGEPDRDRVLGPLVRSCGRFGPYLQVLTGAEVGAAEEVVIGGREENGSDPPGANGLEAMFVPLSSDCTLAIRSTAPTGSLQRSRSLVYNDDETPPSSAVARQRQ